MLKRRSLIVVLMPSEREIAVVNPLTLPGAVPVF